MGIEVDVESGWGVLCWNAGWDASSWDASGWEAGWVDICISFPPAADIRVITGSLD